MIKALPLFNPLAGRKRVAAKAKPERLRNTPPVVNKGVRLFSELVGDPSWHASRLWVLCMAMAMVVIALALALYRLIPLKTVVPYFVEQTSEGIEAHAVAASANSPSANMLKAEIGRWVTRMETLDPYQTKANLRLSVLPLRGKAISQHAEFLEREKPFARMLEKPDLVREVDVRPSGVDISQKGIAFVFFSTTERHGTEPKVVKRYRLTIHYTNVLPEKEEEVMTNPVGLIITYFDFQEILA